MKFRHKCCGCSVPTEHKLVNALYELTSSNRRDTPESEISKKLNELVKFSIKNSDNIEAVSITLANQIKKDLHRNRIIRVRYGLRFFQCLWANCEKNHSHLMPYLIQATSSLSSNLLNSSESEFVCYGLDFYMKMAANNNIKFSDSNYLWHHGFFVERITHFCIMPHVEYKIMAILSIQALIKNSIVSNKKDLVWLPSFNIKIVDSLLWNLNTRNDQVDHVDRKYALECYNDLIDSADNVQHLEPVISQVCAFTQKYKLWNEELVIQMYFSRIVSKDPVFVMNRIEEYFKQRKVQGVNDEANQVKKWLLHSNKYKFPNFE